MASAASREASILMGEPLRAFSRSASRRATSRRWALTSWSTMVAPLILGLLMASSTMTGPKDMPPAPTRQMRGGRSPCSGARTACSGTGCLTLLGAALALVPGVEEPVEVGVGVELAVPEQREDLSTGLQGVAL